MKLTKEPTNVTITLSPKDYWIKKNEDYPDFLGNWCLVRRIDMSYTGKPDQEGVVFMYLEDSEMKIFKDAGFEETY